MISTALCHPIERLRAYARPRPTTSGNTNGPSASLAAFSGGLTGYVSTGFTPSGALGAAAGSALGLYVGQKTMTVSAAVAASALGGAAVTVAVSLACVAVGWAPAVSLPMLAFMGTIGGLSAVSGMMEGCCQGNIKDAGAVGIIAGGVAASMGGSPLLTVGGALSGSVAGMVSSPLRRILVGTVCGAASGAAAGALAGPLFVGLNAALGAATGAVAAGAGPGLCQIVRNAREDLLHAQARLLYPLTDGLGLNGRTLLGALGGALSSAPLAFLSHMITGPIGAAVVVTGGAVVQGWRVRNLLKTAEKLKPYRPVVREHLLTAHTDPPTPAPHAPPPGATSPPEARRRLPSGFPRVWKRPPVRMPGRDPGLPPRADSPAACHEARR